MPSSVAPPVGGAADDVHADMPRRVPRARKLPSRLRSPSPTPLLARRADEPAPPPAVLESRDTDVALGPGKRQRRPSTMYRPPETLTAEPRRSPPMERAEGKRVPSRAKPSRAPSRASLTPPPDARASRFTVKLRVPFSENVHAPATFTRHGERIPEPPRRRSSTSSSPGICSPKPVRTAPGVWRNASPEPCVDEEEDEDDEEDDIREVARPAAVHIALAEQAWSMAMPAAADDSDGDDDDNDFHKSMLDDPELDMLMRGESRDSDEASDALTDGHVTTPASSGGGKDNSPAATRGVSPVKDEGDATVAVFAHALPVPSRAAAEPGTHAGSLTLSLPYAFGATPAEAWPMGEAAAPLDTDDTPLTPVRTVTAAEIAERMRRSSPGEGVHSPDALPTLAAPSPSLPSALPEPAAASSSAGASPHPQAASPALLDDDTPLSDDARTPDAAYDANAPAWLACDAPLCLALPRCGDDDDDALFSPEKMMGLTELDRVWDDAPPRTKRARRMRRVDL